MKRIIGKTLSMFILLALIISPASATKPGELVNPNGFPSGPHFNLNFNAKPDHFTCPAQEYYLEVTSCGCSNHNLGDLVKSCDELDVCELTDIPIYGNVIFIPREQADDPITVLMESGKKGPKGNPDAQVLEVTDWCTESFPQDGANEGDPAVLRLPRDPEGYAVYARITGKPGVDETDHTIDDITPELFYAEDEDGNDFIHLGFIKGDQVFNTDGVELPLQRTSGGKRGNGVQRATNITGLFEWSGMVCYIDHADYCLDDLGNPILDIYDDPICTPEGYCCVDMDDSQDGVYEHCDLLADVGMGDPLECPAEYCEAGGITCYPYVSLDLMCREYDNDWVFNIADFVGYLWHIISTGAYHVQVRFYPLSTMGE